MHRNRSARREAADEKVVTSCERAGWTDTRGRLEAVRRAPTTDSVIRTLDRVGRVTLLDLPLHLDCSNLTSHPTPGRKPRPCRSHATVTLRSRSLAHARWSPAV